MKKSLLTIIGLSANLFLIGCADDQARQQIADTNQRLSQIQQNVGVLDNKVSNQKLIDLLNQINDLQTQINQLNGRVSNLEQGQKTGQGDQNQQVQALELRVQALEDAAGGSKAANAAKPTVVTSSNNPELQAAVKKLQNKQIPEAITDLQNIANGSDKVAAASANYYLSVAYVANSEYKEAITQANKFIAENPNNKFVPDAMRVVYISQSQLGNTKAANATAKKLIKSFPNSEAAKKVAKQLQQ
ncbi:MAG: outer membrane protein assembly factor BamD [Neisseriales bacterium]|jgi:TolA-binding protein|nr:MAG: outer membrane protein assembly factor BamD [Neisseriales bacterium]